MAQHIANSEHRTRLENILRDYRKFGLSCVFSDQMVSNLTGLTDGAKEQLLNRVAMRNSLDEMKQTLAVTVERYTSEMLMKMEECEKGDLWFKYQEEGEASFEIKPFKALYIDEENRLKVIEKANKQYADVNFEAQPIKINKNERVVMPIEEIKTFK